MTGDLDVMRAANVVLQQYGDDADYHAAGRADALLLEGDVEGSLVWMRVLRAIKTFRASRQPGHLEN